MTQKDEEDYEVREFHGVGRGLMGGLIVALVSGGASIYFGYHPMVGIAIALCIVSLYYQGTST